jgi:LysR family hydrogen peroxide-inducible transcriptional activator
MVAIARDPFVIAAPFDDPVGLGPPARPTDLRHRPVFLLDDGHCFRDQALALCTDARAHEGDFRATSISTLAQMVAAGSGITLLPALAVSTETQRAKLAIRTFAEPAPHRTIVMAWRKRSPLHEALRAVAATIRYAYPRPALRARRARRTKV